jgi:hypothetical protein
MKFDLSVLSETGLVWIDTDKNIQDRHALNQRNINKTIRQTCAWQHHNPRQLDKTTEQQIPSSQQLVHLMMAD